MSSSRRTKEDAYLQDLIAKRPISWGDMKDDRWSAIDAVSSKLHTCNSLSERVKLLEETIYNEGLKIFGHEEKNHRNLSGKSRRTLRSINLVKMKNSLLHQIASCFIPSQKSPLEELLVQVRNKIKAMRSSERRRKRKWHFKKAQIAFRNDPYKAGKALLDPKCQATLKVDQATLDGHKHSTVHDPLYDIPLEDLDGLPSAPLPSKPFKLSSLKYEDFELG